MLARYPNGFLVEEALALRLECAQALGGDATSIAREYLRRFPEGTFAKMARRALAPAGSRE